MSQNVAEELTTDQRRAIGALLTEKSLTDAAEVSKVNRRTLQRWLKEEPFKAALNEASVQVLDQAIRKMTDLLGAATEVLADAMNSVKMAERLRAVDILLNSYPAIRQSGIIQAQLEELAERVAEIENEGR
jgi:stalled ribosome rescue protein Dom34